MSANTKIEWADHTFNPWIGCTKVSPGCDNCYAEADFDKRRHIAQWGAGQPRHRTAPSTWAMPRRWNAQAAAEGRRFRVFCASLADVFDNEVPQLWRQHLMSLVADTPHLDWLFLTKRIGNARRMLSDASMHDGRLLTADDQYRPPENLWIGATMVDQSEVDRDYEKLMAVPAARRFLSIEPMLGPISLRWLSAWPENAPTTAENPSGTTDHLDGLRRLDWVIVGGESGLNARQMHPDWARILRDQCAAAGVQFLFKQWGEWKPVNQMADTEHRALYRSKVVAEPHQDQAVLDDIWGRRCTVPYTVVHPDGSTHDILEPGAWTAGAMQTFKVGKKTAGRLLDGIEHNGFPKGGAA